MVRIFNGKKLAQKLEKEIKKKVGNLEKKFGLPPKLVSIVVGEDKASHLYLSLQEKAAKKVGILFEKKAFPVKTDPQKVIAFINRANVNPEVSGIVVQLPLPSKLETGNWKLEIPGTIVPSKDVDCLTPENLGFLFLGEPVFLPPVVKAIFLIFKREKIGLKGKNVVIVGAGDFVGKPLAIHLKNLGATVILCDEFTKNLKEWTKRGEILISATGVPGLIKREMVKKGAMVIDVGSPKGDVDFKAVKKVASFITPVPGGVGPLTTVCLLENVLLAFDNLRGKR